MNYFYIMDTLLNLIVGIALGAGTTWLVSRSQIQSLKSQKQASEEKIDLYRLQRETASKENDEKQQEIEQYKTSLATKEQEIRSFVERVSQADARIERVSGLEIELGTERDLNNKQRAEITSQKERISRLTAELENKEQKIEELNQSLEQVQSEKRFYKEQIAEANRKSAEADAQKEQITELRQEVENINDKNQQLKSQLDELRERAASLKTKLEEEQKSSQEKINLLKNAEQNLANTFKALSANALQNNNQQFIEVAKETLANIHQNSNQRIDNLVSPLHSSLEQFKQQIVEIENTRRENKGQISEQLQLQVSMMNQLQSETANLTKALRQPVVRGRWGEVQLKRVVEMSGMQEHCDFTLQTTINTEDGAQRPDMVVILPGNRTVVVDSKAPLKAYLEAVEASEESTQIECLKNHARHIRTHISQLSNKSYWERFEHTPEFVVMFLPGEVFFSAALQQDPRLIEYGIEKKIVLATPTTLISLLKTIEYGWRQEQVAKNAQEIGNLGRELYDRFNIFTNHFDNIRKKLDDTVKTYNQTVGSYNSRLLVTARKFQEVGGYDTNEIFNIESIDRSLSLVTQEHNLDMD